MAKKWTVSMLFTGKSAKLATFNGTIGQQPHELLRDYGKKPVDLGSLEIARSAKRLVWDANCVNASPISLKEVDVKGRSGSRGS